VLDITDGQLSFGSAVEAPFDYDLDLDPAAFTPTDEYSVEMRSQSSEGLIRTGMTEEIGSGIDGDPLARLR